MEVSGAVRGVTFDFWNTLVFEDRGHLRGRRLERWAGILEDAGYPAERAHLGAIYDEVWDDYVHSWRANQQFLVAQAAERAVEQLGFEVGPDVRAALIDAFGRAGEGAELHLVPGVATCVTALSDTGVALGIVCDVGFTPSRILKAFLGAQGLLERFDAVAFSDEVGVYKPDPAIFEHALAGMGVAPVEAAHVGDLRRTDVAGARALGMTTVRFAGVNDDDSQTEPEADFVVSDYGELPGVLGLV